MAFTPQELANMAAALTDYHWNTPTVRSQTIQDKPLLKMLRGKAEQFPGGKDLVDFRVKGVYTTTIQGFVHDDTVSYANPANIMTGSAPWKLVHAGISFTMHEMVKAGVQIADTTTGEKTTTKSNTEKVVLAKLLNDKIEDMKEGWDRGFNAMYWANGVATPNLVPGIKSFIVDAPAAAGSVFGIDPVVNTWWRNRANLTISLGSSAATGAVFQTLQREFRQLRRFGGRPDSILAGSDMMARMEDELKAQGFYTQGGWAKTGSIDASVTDIAFKGVMIEYDPTLDDMSESKRCYVLDSRTIKPMVVDGEDGKDHAPARPETKYVFYRARTWVGGLICNQRNANGVYAFP